MALLEEVVIVSAVRTPIGKVSRFVVGLDGDPTGSNCCARGGEAAPESIRRRLSECIMGNVVGAGLGQNPARQAALVADCNRA